LRNILTLTVNRMRLAIRTPAFIFFSLAMPLAFLFTFCGLFGHGRPQAIPYLLASVLALTVMGSFWGLSLQLVTYREMGILRRFHLAPVGAGAMLASSILSNYLLTLPAVVLQFLLARWVFHLPAWGNLTGVLVMVTLGTVTFAALGLIVASVTDTAQETQIINNAFWLVFLFLSGATLPLPLFPNWLQGVALFVPATYLVSGLERTLASGTSTFHLGAELLSLSVCAVLALVICRQLFRWDPGEKAPRRARLWAASTIIPFILLGAWEIHSGSLIASARANLAAMERQVAPENIPH
jgi:ABC-type multidrug transport system permease subunit